MTTELTPHWLRELARLAETKSQLYVFGNINDTVLYPLGEQADNWTLAPLREALFEAFRHQVGGYELIAAYNLIDGMTFADARDENMMASLYDEIVVAGEKEFGQPQKGRLPQPIKARDQLDQALQQMRLCLMNRTVPSVFILEHASQLLASPVNLPQQERMSFLRLLKSSGESRTVAVGEGPQRRAVQNLLVLLCDKLTDLPAWLYLNNPFAASMAIETPKTVERQHFFSLFLPPHQQTDEGQDIPQFDPDDLADLTEGMTVRDLCGIRSLARRPQSAGLNAKALVDAYKYGGKESEWDNLDWERLVNAEEQLSHRVIGQPAAVAAVADVLRRARLHLSGAQHSSRTKPRGVLFFAGPTGVGKTELAKDIAELIFGTEEACIRFDMSEYSLPHADQRLLGAPPGYVGYEEGGQLTNRIKADPFCVLLFDEIEKAHASVLDKFLQILDDGRMTDGRGETVYFSESIIIFTSNIGIHQLDPETGRPQVDPFTGKPLLHVDPAVDTEYPAVKAKVTEGVQAYFKHVLGRPELLNRIGQNIIVFDYIREPVMRQILERKIYQSIQDQVYERWKLRVAFTPAVTDTLIDIGKHDVGSGGRGMGNLAESALLNPLARAMFPLLHELGSLEGKTLTVTEVIPPQSSNDYRYEITWEIE